MTRTNRDNSEIVRQRINQEIETAELIRRAAVPHDKTLVGAAPQLAVLAATLAVHVDKLKEIRSLV